jgi:arginyl-tRNA synthetase
MAAMSEIEPSDGDLMSLFDGAMRRAIVAVLGEGFREADGAIRPSQNPQFGDFQSNAAMVLAKQAGKNPRQLGEMLAKAVDVSAIAEEPKVEGPGFINFRLKPATLANLLDEMDSPALGIRPMPGIHSIVVDLCGVNVAKQMHVGHLRATIIGDALARTYERLGRKVQRENHLGDWGLPIAMVLHRLRADKIDLDRINLDALNDAYRDAQLSGRDDAKGLAAAIQAGAGPHRIIELTAQNLSATAEDEAAKQTLVRLQSGDADLLRDWRKIIEITLREVYEAARILNVNIGPQNNRGESFYRARLAGVVESYVQAGLGVEDAGAIVVRFADRERPLLIRKSDGGFLYATTDLAAVRYRVQDLDGERVIYVVDARQRDHFKDVFEAASMIGWDRNLNGDKAELIHLGFGAVLGKDKKPLKTRSGENFTLMALLREAIERGASEVIRRAEDPASPTHGLPEAELRRIGQAVGIAAVKYADLGSDVIRDYVFDLDRMIAFEGDTGPYIQYAHARICSIFAKAEETAEEIRSSPFAIMETEEKQLALMLLKYPNVVVDVARTLEPHRLCAYVYGLANMYSAFYQACPVLKAEDARLRRSRLRLCDLTRRVLADGLGLLGIEAPMKM